MRKLPILLSLLFSIQLHADPQPNPWTVSAEEVFAVTARPVDRQIPMFVLVERGSKWDQRSVLQEQFSKVSRILSQCGLGLGEVLVQYVVFNPGALHAALNSSPYEPPGLLKLLEGEFSAVRPMAMLIGPSNERRAFAIHEKSVQFYRSLFPNSPVERMQSITLLTDHYTTNAPVPAAAASYNTLAHELIHIFTNDGHINVHRNIMSAFDTPRGTQTGDLIQSQCEQMLRFPGLRP
jgi:hypothetical protein